MLRVVGGAPTGSSSSPRTSTGSEHEHGDAAHHALREARAFVLVIVALAIAYPFGVCAQVADPKTLA